MSDTHDLIGSTLDKVLTRVDVLAEKLGIAAKEVWRFSVIAMVVEAKCDLYKGIALCVLPLILWSWAAHVALHPLPHDHEQVMGHKQTATPITPTLNKNGQSILTCGPAGICTVSGSELYQQTSEDTPEMMDKGLGVAGWLLAISAAICAIMGIVFAYEAVDNVFDALAAAKTAEYDAYQNLISDWKD